MRVLLTGVSSFTGSWFARALVAAGHDVVATLRGSPGAYQGLRAVRLAELPDAVRLVPECAFGADAFLAMVAAEDFDVLCHHGATVGDYRSADFDVAAAVAANTRALPDVLRRMQARRLARVVVTGSVFENDEGLGEEPLRAFSPYGLSKGLSWQVFRYWCGALELPLGKFVIPNPFGPFEEPRFTAYLMRCWRAGEVAAVRTPAYVRDNIHVRLLAEAYAGFAARISAAVIERLGPSGYVESQGAFAQRCAREVAARTGLPCELALAEQVEFLEPLMRVNGHPGTVTLLREASIWDEYLAGDTSAKRLQ